MQLSCSHVGIKSIIISVTLFLLLSLPVKMGAQPLGEESSFHYPKHPVPSLRFSFSEYHYDLTWLPLQFHIAGHKQKPLSRDCFTHIHLQILIKPTKEPNLLKKQFWSHSDWCVCSLASRVWKHPLNTALTPFHSLVECSVGSVSVAVG